MHADSPNQTRRTTTALIVGLSASICYACYKIYRSNTKTKISPNSNTSAVCVDKSTEGKPKLNGITKSKTICIYFASQSGTGQGFSETLYNELKQRVLENSLPFDILVQDLDLFNEDQMVEADVHIYLVSTYGNGEPPDNARGFDIFLNKLCHNNDPRFKSKKYAVFGLGSKAYIKFAHFGKTIHSNYLILGSEPIFPYTTGDDSEDIRNDFRQWKDNLWKALSDSLEVPLDLVNSNGCVIPSQESIISKFKLELVLSKSLEEVPKAKQIFPGGIDTLSKQFFTFKNALVINHKYLTDNNWAFPAVEVELDITESANMSYSSGDTVDILPRCDNESVKWALNKFFPDIDPDSIVSFLKAPKAPFICNKLFPSPISLYSAIEQYIDLNALPDDSKLTSLAAFTSEEEKSLISSLLDSKHSSVMDSVRHHMLTLPEFIDIFMPSLSLTPTEFFYLFPKQKFRSYTISSSPYESKNTLKVVISLLHSPRQTLKRLTYNPDLIDMLHHQPSKDVILKRLENALSRDPLNGNCSGFITHRISINDKILIRIKKSVMGLILKEITVPILGIGAGTGIAPFKAYAEEIKILNSKDEKKPEFSLIYGFRDIERDCFFRELWLGGEKDKWLNYQEAQSRKRNKGQYVQDVLLKNPDLVKKYLIDENGFLIVCGNRQMGKAIENVVRGIVGDEQYIKIVSDERVLLEVW